MASITQAEFESKLVEPALTRRNELPAEIEEAERKLAGLISAADYDDEAADAAELHLARLRREEARMHRRVRALTRRLEHVAGTDRRVSA